MAKWCKTDIKSYLEIGRVGGHLFAPVSSGQLGEISAAMALHLYAVLGFFVVLFKSDRNGTGFKDYSLLSVTPCCLVYTNVFKEPAASIFRMLFFPILTVGSSETVVPSYQSKRRHVLAVFVFIAGRISNLAEHVSLVRWFHKFEYVFHGAK
jgi:hypothetical protein